PPAPIPAAALPASPPIVPASTPPESSRPPLPPPARHGASLVPSAASTRKPALARSAQTDGDRNPSRRAAPPTLPAPARPLAGAARIRGNERSFPCALQA